MNHLTGWGLDQASDKQRRHEAERAVDEVLACARQPLIEVVVIFFANPIGPLSLMTLEMALLELVREIGRQLLELVLNTCEPDRPDELPQHVRFECSGYRRRNQKTANRNVASRFGVSTALERSRSGNGGHVWMFFESAIPAAMARRLGTHILTETMEHRPEIGLDSYDRPRDVDARYRRIVGYNSFRKDSCCRVAHC